jgi:glucose-induced degradation protein 8
VISADGFKRDINYLVMDYLVTNGYPSAAKRFAVEANIQPKADVESIQERVEIRNAIHSGDIQTAIEKINELNHQVGILSSSYPVLSFAMIKPVSCTTHIPSGFDDKNSSSVLSMSTTKSLGFLDR